VTELLTYYSNEREPKVAAPVRIGYAISALTDFFEGSTVADVTPETCARYAENRSRSAGTVRRELGVLRAAINRAHRVGRLTRSVAVELPEGPEPKDRWLSRKEAAGLIRAARTPQARLYMPLFILLGLYTGRRKEAILSLRWPQVNLETRTINFDIAGRTRTKKRRGMIPIPPRLLPHLRRLRRRGTELGYVLHINGERKKGFAAACDRAGIAGTTPHTLRHTAATWIARDGKTSLADAADYLAMSEETLRRVYRHHHPEFLRGVAESIGKRPGNVRVIA
jgi:integrase